MKATTLSTQNKRVNIEGLTCTKKKTKNGNF